MKKSLKYLSIALLIPATLWAGTLTGNVTSGGTAIENALVVIRQGSTTAAVYDSVRTSATGTYTFSALTAATYYVTTSATGFVTISNRNVNVTANGTATSNFTLTASIGTITGSVRSGGHPVPDLEVILSRGTDSMAATTTDSNGLYTFSNIPAGAPNYSITVFNPLAGQPQTNSNIAVTSGGTVTSNFLLGPTALQQTLSHFHAVNWVRSGDRLNFDLGVSTKVRSLSVLSLEGRIQYRATVAAGESRTTVPATFAKGFLFQVK